MMLIKRRRSTAQQTAAQLQRLNIQCVCSRFLSLESYVAVTPPPNACVPTHSSHLHSAVSYTSVSPKDKPVCCDRLARKLPCRI